MPEPEPRRVIVELSGDRVGVSLEGVDGPAAIRLLWAALKEITPGGAEVKPPEMTVHICTPLDTTRTLCGLPAVRVAAVDWAPRADGTARGPFCEDCESHVSAELAAERAQWAAEDAAARL